MSNLFFDKYATLKSIEQVWKKSKAYTNAIPDNLGFWNGTHLTIDNLPDGDYILKYSVDSREYEEQTEITVAGITKVELKLPDSTSYIVVYSTTGELMGRIRTSARYGINVDGATSSSVVVLANESGFITTTVAIGNKVELKVNYESTESGLITGNGAGQLTVNGVVCSSFVMKVGSNTIDVTDYLTAGTNTVRVKATDIYGASKTLIFTIEAIELRVSSTFDDSVAYGDVIQYKYIAYGTLEKTVYIHLDGAEIYKETMTASGRTVTVNIPKQTHGVHRLECWATGVLNEQDLESEHLVYDVMCTEEGNTEVLIASVYSKTSVKQGEMVSIPYSVFVPDALSAEVSLKVEADGEEYSSKTLTVNRQRQFWNERDFPAGAVDFVISCGDVEKRHSLTVAEADVNVEAVTNDLELYLAAAGRSNKEDNPARWEYQSINTEFSNMNWASNGWISDENGDTVLRLNGSAKAEIQFMPFKEDWKVYGKTLEFEFAIRDVNNRDAVVISCMSGGVGLEVTADTARLKSKQSEIFCNFADEEKVRVTFVTESKNEYRLLQVYINGYLSGTKQYAVTDDFQQSAPVNITIGSELCGVDIYSIRSYSNALTFTEIINNDIADTADISEKIRKYEDNNLYDEYGALSYEAIKAKIPVMTIIGSLPQSKGDKKNVVIKFEHNIDASLNFEDTAQIDVQGTSSQWYIRKNYKEKMGEAHMHAVGQMPTRIFCTKADYAESTGTHNTQNANLVETLYSEKTPAQEDDERCRTTIYGYPIVIFHQPNSWSAPVFIGKYNFNFDKGSEEVYGFGGEHNAQSWEFLNNTSDACNFHREIGSSWTTDFEARYPDGSSDITKFKEMHDWVVSTIGDVDKFKAEFEQHFDLHFALIYYVYTSVMLMVDQRAKNMFLTYWEDTDKWQPWFYDNDTCLGINNEGQMVFDYYHEDTDTVDGANVYNGQNSTLWTNFRQAFADEIKECYQELRNSGKLSYDKIIEYFITNGSSKWSASIYNEDSDYKYISMLRSSNDATNLYQIRGNGEGHLKYFISNRLKYMDSKWYASDYADNYIALRIYTPARWAGVEPNADITISAFSAMYAGIRYKANGVLQQERVSENQTITFDAPDETFNDTETAIYGASEISSLGDLAPLYCGSVNVSKASRLVNLKIGDGARGYSNTNLKELSVGTNKLLKVLDVRNCPNLTDPLALSGCPNIEEIYATGSGITGVELADSGYLKKMQLPGTVTDLTLKNQLYISELTLEGYDSLTSLNIENCPTVDSADILSKAANLNRVRLTDVEWSFEDASYLMALVDKGIGGIDENGYNTDIAMISGTCHITALTVKEMNAIIANLPYLTIAYDELVSGTSSKLVDRSIVAISNDLVTSIGELAFEYCSSLKTVNLPEATVIGAGSFSFCEKLESLNIPKATTIKDMAFQNCNALTEVDFPEVTKIDGSVFNSCISLVSVNIPKLTSLGASAFTKCNTLTEADFPELTSVLGSAFYNCHALSKADIGKVTNIAASTFGNCNSLTTLILRSETMCTLANTNAFANCYHIYGTVNSTYNPEGLKDGYIYVPSALVDSYKAATNWSTFASQFRAIEDWPEICG